MYVDTLRTCPPSLNLLRIKIVRLDFFREKSWCLRYACFLMEGVNLNSCFFLLVYEK